MKTPLSDAAIEKFPQFAAAVRARLEAGRLAYKDSSFERPLVQLIEELRQEALDLCGWSFIVWARMERLERLVMEVTSPHRPTEDAPAVHSAPVSTERGQPIRMGWPGEIQAEIGEAPLSLPPDGGA